MGRGARIRGFETVIWQSRATWENLSAPSARSKRSSDLDPVPVIQRIDGFEGFVTVVGRLGRFETFPGCSRAHCLVYFPRYKCF